MRRNSVDILSSRVNRAVAEVLEREGFLERRTARCSTRAAIPPCVVTPQVRPGWRPRSSPRSIACRGPDCRVYRGVRDIPKRAQRAGDQRREHLAGGPLGPRGPQQGRRRRDPLRGLVGPDGRTIHHVPSRQPSPSRSSAGVEVRRGRRARSTSRAPKGALEREHHRAASRRSVEDGSLDPHAARTTSSRAASPSTGSSAPSRKGMVEGVTQGFMPPPGGGRRVSYQAAVQGDKPEAAGGLQPPRHPETSPPGVTVDVPQPDAVIVVEGCDKQMVGEFAARIAARVRPPEPYKGKGIRYFGRADHPEGRQVLRRRGEAKPMDRLKTAGQASAPQPGLPRAQARAVARMERPRASACYRTNMHIYAQMIDDESGRTLVRGLLAHAQAALRGQRRRGQEGRRRTRPQGEGSKRSSGPASTAARTGTTAG